MPRPGMPGQRKKAKPDMTRIKTVWVTEKTDPFETVYEKGAQIGEPGQFGRAFKCTSKADGSTYAVKAVSKARLYRLDRDATKRAALLFAMNAEIDVMRRLDHKYIVQLVGVHEDKHTLYIVMEECQGGELFDRIRAKGQYREKEAVLVIRQVLEALHYMHEKHRIVHCDLKPDNILFKDKSEDSDLKIIDFGMSKVLPRLKSLRELCGTPYYTAPEIIKGQYAHKADLWSVGVIMFVMLFGFPPFYVDPKRYYGRAEAQAIYKLIEKGFTPVVKKGYGPWFPQKMPVSDEARDLMKHLIVTECAQRFNAAEALAHPWITGGGAEPLSKEIFAEFAKFNNNCNFKLAVLQIFRGQFQKMRPEHFRQLQEVYKTLDKDGNGEIDYEEFESGMLAMDGITLTQQQIKEMFSELDVKQQGTIGFDELLNAAVQEYLVNCDERLYKAFRELDGTDSGEIETAALRAKLREANPFGNHEALLQVIDDADLDKDGKIDYEEFLRALHPDFNEIPPWFWSAQKTQDADDQKDPANP